MIDNCFSHHFWLETSILFSSTGFRVSRSVSSTELQCVRSSIAVPKMDNLGIMKSKDVTAIMKNGIMAIIIITPLNGSIIQVWYDETLGKNKHE